MYGSVLRIRLKSWIPSSLSKLCCTCLRFPMFRYMILSVSNIQRVLRVPLPLLCPMGASALAGVVWCLEPVLCLSLV